MIVGEGLRMGGVGVMFFREFALLFKSIEKQSSFGLKKKTIQAVASAVMSLNFNRKVFFFFNVGAIICSFNTVSDFSTWFIKHIKLISIYMQQNTFIAV